MKTPQQQTHAAAWKMCDSKKPFATEQQARSFADRFARAQNKARPGSPYQCHYCLNWHLTTKHPVIDSASASGGAPR